MSPQASPVQKPSTLAASSARFPWVAEELDAVKASLLEILTPEAMVLATRINATLKNTGKLFRPALLMLTSKACNHGSTTHDDIETAAVAELIHTATLIHDDVLDDADLRRGQATLKHLEGNRIAILAGDFLLAQASLKLSKLNNCRLVSIYAKVLADLCDGELLQLEQNKDLSTSWESYLRKTACKTATLFEACCESAGVIHQQSPEMIAQLKHYGQCLGIAFQLADDLLDFTASEKELGKPALEDLRQGILTAPVLLALRQTPQNSPELATLTQQVQAVFEDEQAIEPLLLQLKTQGWLDKTQAMAMQYVEDAIKAIRHLPASEYRDALEGLARDAVQRTK